MDYSQLTTPQLQAECKRRGLPTSRVKAELLERLNVADAADGGADDDFAEPEMSVEAEPETVVNEVFPQPPTPKASPVAATPDLVVTPPAPVLPSTVFQHTFPAVPEGPSDDQHAQFRAATRQAAIGAGRTPRGDAHRVGRVAGREVYEVSVRRLT